MAVAPALSYRIHKTCKQPGFGGKWDSPDRLHAETLTIAHAYGEHGKVPQTKLKMLYDETQLYGVFMVQDQYVLSLETEYQSDVAQDACVAAYLQPRPEQGYLALEMNCCGVLRAHYIEEWDSADSGARPHKVVVLPWKQGHQIRIYTTQFGVVSPEVTEPMTWYVEFVIPFSVFESYVGPLNIPSGNPWRANFFKCAGRCSHPHRVSWAPLLEGISFHQPDAFAPIYFG